MKKKNLLVVSIMALTGLLATGCAGSTASSSSSSAAGSSNTTPASSTSSEPTFDNKTEEAVYKAAHMTVTELEAAAKKEMDASDTQFYTFGTTSMIAKGLTAFTAKYSWLTDKVATPTTPKDAQAWTMLDQAEDNYVADVAYVQDARSLGDYIDAGLVYNYVPSDAETLKLPTKNQTPLKGIICEKAFYHKKGLVDFNNVWQVAGAATDTNHISHLSFQNPSNEQINMSFLLNLYNTEPTASLKSAYKDFYGTDWAASSTYATIADEFITEFIKNISTWHTSDGTAMKTTLPLDTEGTVFFGSFAKMKDAAKLGVMDQVDWDFDVKGFKGFMYTIYGQIVNNAKHPYTGCLFERYLLTEEGYKAMCYSTKDENITDKAGNLTNLYGYYYPCESTTVGNDNDYTEAKWESVSVVENYDYLKTVKQSTVNRITALVASSAK
jgi:hypothetical protein